MDSITRILPSIQNCTDCIERDLSYAMLTEIPPEIGKMAQLQSLDLSHNNLKTVPEELMQLQSITKLDFSSNDITEENLTENLVVWLDTVDRDWRWEQKTQDILQIQGRCNYAVGNKTSDPSGYTWLSEGGPDTIPVIMSMDGPSLRFIDDEGPSAGRYFALLLADSGCFMDTLQVFAKRDSIVFNCPPKQPARR
ncbi:MAG TPA: hypothetical protein VHO70_01550 [Chitinispirillaceae bacterium]|nr:hypothetical protein [Chitinispirillaceae bacterium]